MRFIGTGPSSSSSSSGVDKNRHNSLLLSRPASTRLPASNAVFGTRVWKACYQSYVYTEYRRQKVHVTR